MVSLIFQPRWLPGSMLIYQRVTSINSLINYHQSLSSTTINTMSGYFYWNENLTSSLFEGPKKSARNNWVQGMNNCKVSWPVWRRPSLQLGSQQQLWLTNWDIQVDIMRYSQLHHIGNGFEIFGYSSGYTERYSWYNHRHFEKIETLPDVSQAIRETNGESLRDPVLVRCLGLSEEELQDGEDTLW